jgi:hypothetical protein
VHECVRQSRSVLSNRERANRWTNRDEEQTLPRYVQRRRQNALNEIDVYVHVLVLSVPIITEGQLSGLIPSTRHEHLLQRVSILDSLGPGLVPTQPSDSRLSPNHGLRGQTSRKASCRHYWSMARYRTSCFRYYSSVDTHQRP